MARVLIFRRDVLPLSETFIAAQMSALQRYQPVLIGLRRTVPALPHSGVSVVMAGGNPGFLRTSLRTHTRTGRAFTRNIKQQQASLVHAHFATDAAASLPWLQSLNVPLLVTLHGYDVMRSDDFHRRSLQGLLFLHRRRRLWAHASRFICVSHAIREQALRQGYPAQKLIVCPIGTDAGSVLPIQSLTTEPIILFVGRLVPKKGCSVLLQAFALLQKQLPAARLHIVGDGDQRRMLETTAKALTKGTIFHGAQSREQVRAHMRAARCIAVPSLTASDGDAEGLPTVLLEACALALPIVSSVHSGIPELIEHGRHGLLAAEGNAIELAEHLHSLCSDNRRADRLRFAARARVLHEFSLEVQTQQLESLYDAVVLEDAESRPTMIPGKQAKDFQEVAVQPVSVPNSEPSARGRLRHQFAWMLSGNGASILLQALYFLCMGRLLGAQDYGAFVGLVALVNILSQFSSLGMDMVVLRTVARDRLAYAATFGRALLLTVSGVAVLLGAWLLAAHVPSCARLVPLHWRPLLSLLPFLLLSDALCGRVTQLCSRALQGAEFARWSAKLLAWMNALRALSAAAVFAYATHFHAPVSVALWVRVYCLASLVSAGTALGLVVRLLGLPRWGRITRKHLLEGLSFSFSSSSISVYNDLDKTMLVSYGMLSAAGIYTAAYRVIDVVSTPIVSLFAAASPRLFRQGSQLGASAACSSASALLRWAVPFGLAAAPLLALGAPAMPHLFGYSFAGSVAAVRFLCLLPLLRALHYAWGTAITSCSSQWLRTAAQAGSAVLNLCLNLLLIPRWGWQGAATASLLTDGSLALTTFVILQLLVARQQRSVCSSAPSLPLDTQALSGWVAAPPHPALRAKRQG